MGLKKKANTEGAKKIMRWQLLLIPVSSCFFNQRRLSFFVNCSEVQPNILENALSTIVVEKGENEKLFLFYYFCCYY